MKNQKGFAPIVIILIVIGVLVAGGGVYYYWQKSKVSAPATTPALSPTSTPSASTNETANWQTYRNEEYGFELKYPAKWNYKAVEEKDSISLELKRKEPLVLNNGTKEEYGDVFLIDVFSLDWWNNNAEIEPDGGAYLKNSGHTAGDVLGIYLAKNYKYVFTYWLGQDLIPPEVHLILSTFKFIPQ